jgi:hypothetical protein
VPTVTIPAASAWTSVTFGSTGKPCFQNGIDTVKAVLYDAPYNQDTLHQISVFLTTGSLTLKGTTSPFILLPGPLDSISIEDANFIAIPGPVTLNYPGDMRFFYSNGYDRYQNLIGHINTSWTPTDNLHAIPPPADNIFRIYYEAVDANEQGFILTQTPSLARSGVVLFDSVEVRNIGSQAVLDSAVTKDLNGNGYLDHIFVYFNKPVSLDASYAVSNITLRYTTTVFAIDSVRVADAGNKVFIIYLRDSVNAQNGVNTAKAPPPQTGWRPLLTMNNLAGAAPIVNVKCRDGAGPVIWRVVVNRNKVSDRKQDLVTITFSEPIKSGITGDAFQPTTAPGSVFNVWKSAGGTFTKLDNILAGIGSFNQIPDPLTLTFYMTNAKELFSYDYFNIKSDNVFSSISDNAFAGKSNIPLEINQKVLVEIQGAGGTLQVGPNPLIPTISNGGPDGSVNFKNEPQAVNWVRNNGGTIFRVLISPGQGTVTGYLKIYDVVGNLVNEGRQDKDMMKEIRDANPNDTSAVYDYDIYWNGTNSQGMKCAPGAYVGIVYLTTTKIGGSNTAKLVQKVGVARKTASAHH